MNRVQLCFILPSCKRSASESRICQQCLQRSRQSVEINIAALQVPGRGATPTRHHRRIMNMICERADKNRIVYPRPILDWHPHRKEYKLHNIQTGSVQAYNILLE